MATHLDVEGLRCSALTAQRSTFCGVYALRPLVRDTLFFCQLLARQCNGPYERYSGSPKNANQHKIYNFTLTSSYVTML